MSKYEEVVKLWMSHFILLWWKIWYVCIIKMYVGQWCCKWIVRYHIDYQWYGVVVWLTSGLIWTGCRLVTLSWVPGSVLAIWEVACTTDLCWDKYASCLKCQWHINFILCLCVWAHFTCWAACTCWTTCVGTPVCTTAGGGLESDTLSLEWREPSEGQRENSNAIINFTLMKSFCH